MAISSGEEPRSNNNSPIRKRPRITIRYRGRESKERHVVEAQGGSGVNRDRESDAGEGRERQNEETEEGTEVEEAAENVNAEEEAVSVYQEEGAEDADAEESFCGDEVACGGDNVCTGARDGSISVTLTEPDIFDCCICYQPLSVPVFQCENGHIACSTCCFQLANKCHLCRAPIGHIRCRAIEKVMESIKISCCYAQHGCVGKISHINKSFHEKHCIYKPCWCPFDGCQFTAPRKKLYQHIIHEHHGSLKNFNYYRSFYLTLGLNQKVVVLKELTDSNLFIITNDLDPLGNVIKIFHVGPKSSAQTYWFSLSATSHGSCLKQDSFVNHTRGDNVPPTTKFLLVPTDFFGPSAQLNIEIRIMNPASASNS